MQLPHIDRTTASRPLGADAVPSSVASRVIPVAPVNPVMSADSSAKPALAPGVVNLVNQSAGTDKPNQNTVYNSVSDPARQGTEAATGSKDWTIHRPKVEPVTSPPPEPISKMLIKHMRNMWEASAAAVTTQQIQKQVAELDAQATPANPGKLAIEALTYSPSKIRKPGNSSSGNAA